MFERHCRHSPCSEVNMKGQVQSQGQMSSTQWSMLRAQSLSAAKGNYPQVWNKGWPLPVRGLCVSVIRVMLPLTLTPETFELDPWIIFSLFRLDILVTSRQKDGQEMVHAHRVTFTCWAKNRGCLGRGKQITDLFIDIDLSEGVLEVFGLINVFDYFYLYFICWFCTNGPSNRFHNKTIKSTTLCALSLRALTYTNRSYKSISIDYCRV